jgi:DNA-binding transcriptional ArsR family regulator
VADCCDLTTFFKALSDETRQRILEILQAEGEQCVSDLVERFNLSQPTISHHLNFLRQANLVTSHKKGKQIYYRANEENIVECCGILYTKFAPVDLEIAALKSGEAIES